MNTKITQNNISMFLCNYFLSKRDQIMKNNLEAFAAKKVEEEKKNWIQTVTYKQSEFKNNLTTIDDIKNVLNRKWKNRLFNSRALTEWVYRVTLKHSFDIPEIPISSCLECLVERRGNPKNVRKDIETLVMCDVLKRIPYSYIQKGCTGSNDYHWGSNGYVQYEGKCGGTSIIIKDTKENMCYRYIVNKPMLKLIRAIQKDLFGKYHWKDIFDKVEEAKKDISEFDYQKFEKKYGKRIHLDCNLRIALCEFESKKQLEQLVTIYMLRNNPTFGTFIKLRDTLNRNLTPDSKGHYTLKFHYSKTGKMLTGLSLRDWNDFCTFKSNVKKEIVQDDNNNYYWNEVLKDNYTGKRFYDELYKKHGWNKKYVHEYDVKSSVPRILYFKNYGKWLSQNVDIYELIYGFTFKDKLTRDLFKKITLPAIFTPSLDKFIYNVKLHFTNDEVKVMDAAKQYCDELNYEDFACYIWTCVHKMFPEIDGTTVFQNESEIMMLVEKQLQDVGIVYEHKFDAFYTTTEIYNFDDLLTHCANMYKMMCWYDKDFLPEPNNDNYIEHTFNVINTIDKMRI